MSQNIESEKSDTEKMNSASEAPKSEPAIAASKSGSAPAQVDAPADKQPITDQKKEKSYRSDAKKLLKEARTLFKRGKKSLSADRQNDVSSAIDALSQALAQNEYSCKPALDNLTSILSTHLKFAKKSGAQEIFESLFIALAVALVLRTFLVEPFKIPTRSMVPTLLEGDQLFVTKLSYGIRLPFLNDYVVRFSDPERGDVIVFAFPREEARVHLARTNSGCMAAESLTEDKDYIKRVIAVPGDRVEVVDQVVYVNGEPIAQYPIYQRTVSDYRFLTDRLDESWNREKHGDHSYMTITHAIPDSHFGPITVQPDHLFVMGDNRDNSADSRCWGQVPMANVKGRAQILWWSQGHVGLRTERMFTWID